MDVASLLFAFSSSSNHAVCVLVTETALQASVSSLSRSLLSVVRSDPENVSARLAFAAQRSQQFPDPLPVAPYPDAPTDSKRWRYPGVASQRGAV